jgi:hypothetical protein
VGDREASAKAGRGFGFAVEDALEQGNSCVFGEGVNLDQEIDEFFDRPGLGVGLEVDHDILFLGDILFLEKVDEPQAIAANFSRSFEGESGEQRDSVMSKKNSLRPAFLRRLMLRWAPTVSAIKPRANWVRGCRPARDASSKRSRPDRPSNNPAMICPVIAGIRMARAISPNATPHKMVIARISRGPACRSVPSIMM